MTKSVANILAEPSRSFSVETWRLLPFSRASSARHVALSDALVRLAPMPTIWWHAADAPTLLLGAGQAEPGHSTADALVTRRRSGGTAVLATPAVLGLDVALPREHRLAPADVVEAYRWFGETWADALGRLGIEARVVSIAEARSAPAPPGELAAAVRLACFGTLSPYEVVAGERKVVGLAQVRRRNALLQSGVHLRFDDHTLARHLAPERAAELAAELRRRAAGLDELGGTDLQSRDVIHAFSEALIARHGVELAPGEWTDEELAYAESVT